VPSSTLSIPIRTSFLGLFVRDEKRDKRLSALSHVLEHGSEEQYLELLVSWGVPADALDDLLNQYRQRRKEKRGLRQ